MNNQEKLQKKAENFSKELEKLSKKHGISMQPRLFLPKMTLISKFALWILDKHGAKPIIQFLTK